MKGRKATPLEWIDQYDFDKLSKTTRNSREQKRYLALAHIKEGKSFKEVSQMVRVSYRTIMNWTDKFRKKGVEGLKDKFGGGARPHVPSSQHETFRQSVLNLQKSRLGGRIRGDDIQDLIEREYGVRPSKASVYATLKRTGLVWITGRSRHPKADKEAQEDFKKTL